MTEKMFFIACAGTAQEQRRNSAASAQVQSLPVRNKKNYFTNELQEFIQSSVKLSENHFAQEYLQNKHASSI